MADLPPWVVTLNKVSLTGAGGFQEAKKVEKGGVSGFLPYCWMESILSCNHLQ